MSTDIQRLGRRLVGRWTTEATRRALPDADIAGWAQIDWLDGDRIVVIRSHYDHPDIPDAISILGDTEGLRMHYFDSRGVFRLFELTVTDNGWTVLMSRTAAAGSFALNDAPFSQRLTHVFSNADRTIAGLCQLSHDDVTWQDDLEIIYTRVDGRS